MTPSPTPSLDGEAGEASLKPCPFCGWQAGNDLIDVVYPTGSYAHWLDPLDHSQGLHFNREPKGAAHEVVHVGCTENMGGCGASVLGLGYEGAVAAWNRRAAIPALPPDTGKQAALSLIESALLHTPVGDDNAEKLADAIEAVRSLRATSKADERMRHDYPILQQFHARHALGAMAAPSCLCCGHQTHPITRAIAVQHMELPAMVVCQQCKAAASQPAPTPDAAYEKMRLTLIGQVHELIDIAERHAWIDDPEERKRTEGAIAHARKVTAPYNYNGRRAASMQDTSSTQSPQGGA